MKVLLLGAPASGKGTFGNLISKSLNLPIISSGDLLRAMDKNHPRFAEIHDTMLRGELVDQTIVRDLLIERTALPDCSDGYILEGWGRTMLDIELFDPTFDIVVYFEISQDLAFKRILGRRSCPVDGSVYNIHTNAPNVEGKCDVCGGDLIQRKDDNEDTLNKRFFVFNNETMPVIKMFSAQGKLFTVDGSGEKEVVCKTVVEKINSLDK